MIEQHTQVTRLSYTGVDIKMHSLSGNYNYSTET